MATGRGRTGTTRSAPRRGDSRRACTRPASRKGDAVLLWGENRPEWIVAFWACLLRGIVVVPIDYRSAPSLVDRIGGIVSARLLLAGEDVDAGAVTLDVPRWPLTELLREDGTGGDGRLGEAPTADAVPPVTITADDTAEIIFTSGATAEPKGVIITHRNVLANIVPIEREMVKYQRYIGPFSPIRFLNLLPLSHMFGQAMATFVPPMLGGTVVFMRSLAPADIVRQIRTRRISVLVSVPKILDVLREYVRHHFPETQAVQPAPESGIAPLPKEKWYRRWWRFRRVHRAFGFKFWSAVVGAAPLDPALEEFWGGLGFLVVQGYGLTETAPIVTLNHPLNARKGSVGKPIHGVDVKIAEDGEILVRGDNVSQGYFGGTTDTTRTLEDGWLHTGDIGGLDEQGRLYIQGRKKEMIVTPDGLNVFPEDVERALLAQPGVRDAAVVGRRWDGEERVHAVLVLEDAGLLTRVVDDANTRLGDHQKIRSASIWTGADLPRTEGTRKLKRTALRAWVESGEQAAARPVAGEDPMRHVLARFAKGRADLDDATTVEALALSSLERVELLMALEQHFQTIVDEGAFASARTVGDLRHLVTGTGARVRGPGHRTDRRQGSGATSGVDGQVASRASGHGRLGEPSLPDRGCDAVRFPAVESGVAGVLAPQAQPADVDPAARASVRLAARGGAGAPRQAGGPGGVRVEPPEPHGHAGDPDGPAPALAVRDGGGDGQGVLHGALPSGGSAPRQAGQQRPELLPRLAVLQRLPDSAARGRHAVHAAVHRAVVRRGTVAADLPGGQADDGRGNQRVPGGHRDDRREARRAGRAGPAGGRRPGPAPEGPVPHARAGGRPLRPAAVPARRRLRRAGQAGRGGRAGARGGAGV